MSYGIRSNNGIQVFANSLWQDNIKIDNTRKYIPK